MKVKGWAGSEYESDMKAKNKEIYNMVKDLDCVTIESTSAGYSTKTVTGSIGYMCNISDEELLIYLDKGNLPFGGDCIIFPDGSFKAVIYTD